MIDPEVPGAARRTLEQAPLSALVGFSDPPTGRGGRDDGSDARLAALPGKGLVGGGVLAVVAVTCATSLVNLGPFAADLVFLTALVGLTCIVLGVLSLLQRAAGAPLTRPGPAVAYHRRYVVPELDLDSGEMARWRRASQAARSVLASEAVRLGLIDAVEVTAALPYHLWEVAERLALLTAQQRRQSSILDGLDASDPGIAVVLEPQRRVHDLAVADVERRIGRLEEFAALAVRADAARRRQRAVEELAKLNPGYEELLTRLGEADDALTVTGRSADELRAVVAEADDAVRRANEAGRALAVPSPGAREAES